ncbi:hypothetical protein GCM10023324_06990 [Streptomyces youssoufiensis]
MVSVDMAQTLGRDPDRSGPGHRPDVPGPANPLVSGRTRRGWPAADQRVGAARGKVQEARLGAPGRRRVRPMGTARWPGVAVRGGPGWRSEVARRVENCAG